MKRKSIKLIALSLSFVALTSCGTTARARLNNGDDPLTTTQVAVDGNTLKTLFNTIYQDSSYSSTIKDMFNEQLAKAYLGEYKFVYNQADDSYRVDLIIDDNNTYWSAASNSAKIDFIKSHKAYWNWEDTGISITFEDSSKVSEDNISKYNSRISYICSLVFDKIIENVYTNWISGTYQKDNKFYESLFARNVANQLYSINKKDGSAESDDEVSRLYINPNYSFDKVQSPSKDTTILADDSTLSDYSYALLVDDKYNGITEEGMKNIYSGENQLIHLYRYVDYINATIMPTIQNNLLVEQYIIENQYPSIGITQQRHIEYIEISDTDDKKAKTLLTNYAEEYLSKLTKGESLDFSIASNAWKGITHTGYTLSGVEKTIADKTFGDVTNKCPNENFTASGKYIEGEDLDAYSYYKGSKYASIINDYSKLTTNPNSNDSSLYSSFTSINSKSYTPKQGLKIKTDSLAAENYITNKWGTKSDFSSLPSDLTSKLFSFGIIREWQDSQKDNAEKMDKQYLKSYVDGGITFLKKDTYITTNDYDSIIWENDGKYYIVAVYDCVASTLITKSSTNSDMENIESIARHAGYTLASGSTFTSDALEYYVKNAEIIYFDQKVYEYFKDTFADLFD